MRRFQAFAPCLVLLAVLPCHAQAGSDWGRVQRIPAGQAIRVHEQGQTHVCSFDQADEYLLTCTEHRTIFFIPTHATRHFRRQEVQSVKISRQAASALLGGLVGAGAGAGIGAAIDASAKNQVEEGHLVTVTMGLLAGFVGLAIGKHTDFSAGPTIYRVP